MKTLKIKGIDETLYYEVLDNGLEVYVLPNHNVNRIYATFSTRYGGIHNEFTPLGEKEMIKVPTGIAHFLEHKVFESKDDIDPFSFYAKTGTSCNAFTSSKKTTYLFSADRSIKENLNYLLDFVQSPYFTDENVEKEKGIIEQEIKMYDDDPVWKLYETVMKNLLNEDPHHYSIIGTVEDIRSITKEDLYKCYNTFYHPSNMFVVVTGNVDENEIIEIIKENQSKKDYQKEQKIKKKSYKEKENVSKEYEEICLPVETPKLGYAIKFAKKDLKQDDKQKLNKYLAMILTSLFDVTSLFDEEMKKKGYLTETMELEVMEIEDYYLFMLFADTNYPNELVSEIDKAFSNIRVSEEELARMKKVAIASEISSFDRIVSKNDAMMNSIITYGKYPTDNLKVLRELSKEEMDEIIKGINTKYKTVVIIKSKD